MKSKTVELMLVLGEQGRVIDVELEPAASSPPTAGRSRSQRPTRKPADTSSVTPVAFVLTGVGALALGSFAYFGLRGKSQYDDLERCKGHCSQSEVDATNRNFLIADISVGVAVVSLGAATYLFVSNSRAAPAHGTLQARRKFISLSGRF